MPLRDVANELATSSSRSARLVNVAGLGNMGPELRYRVLQFANSGTEVQSPAVPQIKLQDSVPQFRTRIAQPAMLTSRADLNELVANSLATSRNGLD